MFAAIVRASSLLINFAAERRPGIRFNQLNALTVGVTKAANTTNLLGFAARQFGVRRAVLPFLGLFLRDVLCYGSAIWAGYR